MLNYKCVAFSHEGTLDGKTVSGNPSSIFLLSSTEEFSRETMSKLGIRENYPMASFIKQRIGSVADYDLFHYNLDGSQAYMCGSATMAAAFLLRELFGTHRINFYFDTAPFKVKPDSNLIVARVENGGKVFLEQKVYDYDRVNREGEGIEFIAECLHLGNSSIEEVIRANELNDLIFIVKDNILMRNLRPDFGALVDILDRLEVRNLCTTARSSEKYFDFETRVFVPHDNLDEDLACGSSALPIANYWREKMNKNSFNVLFPYHMEYEDGIVGGVQFASIVGNTTRVGGLCEVLMGSASLTSSLFA
ncbi:MAG: PhzF family phenazine biosynthesis protein [Rickettsiales bacterium]|jgi:PhzF family phenazine biosynthesis protein|nr:PhzF family phenazine biosynthesis protein [Rickettsiales bacterium]